MGPGSFWVDVQPLGSLYQVSFQPFPLNIDFQYGPQPPNLDSVAQPLFPFMDKDASELGPAMFFYDLYDKLTIRKCLYFFKAHALQAYLFFF